MHARAPTPKQWYEIKAKDSGPTEILIYEEIGENWFGEGIIAKKFLEDLKGLKDVIVRINSPGGSVFDGLAIYNGLVRHPSKVTVEVDGLAASIASVVALAGDAMRMAENALLMIHDPWMIAIGTADDLTKAADTMRKVGGNLVDIYHQHSKLSRAKVADFMKEETWFTASEAIAYGFAKELAPAQRMSACFNMQRFKHVPDQLMQNRPRSIANREKLERLQQFARQVGR